MSAWEDVEKTFMEADGTLLPRKPFDPYDLEEEARQTAAMSGRVLLG